MGLDHIRLLLPDQPPDFLQGEGSHGKIGNVPLFQGLPDGAFRAAVVHIHLSAEQGNHLAYHVFRSAKGISGQKMQHFFSGFHNFPSPIDLFPDYSTEEREKKEKKEPPGENPGSSCLRYACFGLISAARYSRSASAALRVPAARFPATARLPHSWLSLREMSASERGIFPC